MRQRALRDGSEARREFVNPSTDEERLKKGNGLWFHSILAWMDLVTDSNGMNSSEDVPDTNGGAIHSVKCVGVGVGVGKKNRFRSVWITSCQVLEVCSDFWDIWIILIRT